MWIVPKNKELLAYVPDMAVSSWDSKELAQLLEPSVMWRSKPTRWQTWLQRLKRVSWMQRLSGRILKPSQQKSFLAKYTASLGVIPANHLVSPESEKEPTIPDTFGRILLESCKQLDLFGASLKTSPDTLPLDSQKFTEAYEIWVTKLRQDCLQRANASRNTMKQSHLIMVKLLKSKGVIAHHTRESDCLSWPTATVSRGGHSQKNGTIKAKLDQEVTKWPTPQTMDCLESQREVFKRGNSIRFKSNQNVEGQAALRDAVGLLAPDSPNTNGKNQELWTTPCSDDTSARKKKYAQGGTALSTQSKGKLNSAWVCSLQGIFPFWLDLYLTPTETTVYNVDLEEKYYETISKILQILSETIGTEAVQWKVGRFWFFFSQEILQSSMFCQREDEARCGKVCFTEKGKQVPKEELPTMQHNETSPNTPCGREYKEQLSKELDDFMCYLSRKMALESWENGIGKIKQNMLSMWRNRPYSPWDVSMSLSESKEIWQSASDEKVGQWVLGACKRYIYWQESRKASPIRVDQLRLAGNGVVPQCAEKALRYLVRQIDEQG